MKTDKSHVKKGKFLKRPKGQSAQKTQPSFMGFMGQTSKDNKKGK